MVNLEVTGVNHRAQRGSDGDAHGVGDAVTHPEPRHFKAFTDLVNHAWINRSDDAVTGYPPLFQFGGYQPVGQARSVDWAIQFRQDKGQCPDMVLVPVGDQDGANLLEPFHQIRNVGDDQVNPKHTFFRELDPAVDDNDIVIVLQGHHVFANLPQASQGNDA